MIKTRTFSNYLIVTIEVKEANLEVADTFKKELLELIDQGHHKLLVDFGKVVYVDSSFLGSLVSCLKHTLPLAGDISVFHLSKDIFNLFRLIRMDKVFKVFRDLPGEL